MKSTWYEVGVAYKNGETESLESRENLTDAITLAKSITFDMKQADFFFIDKYVSPKNWNLYSTKEYGFLEIEDKYMDFLP